MQTKPTKYHLNLAGEYRVCSELLKRGIFATVTFGNMKGADVIAVGSNRNAAVVEVKTSRSQRFVTGFYQKYKTPKVEHPTFWVLYSVRLKLEPMIERFFVLTHEELAEAQARRNFPGKRLKWEEVARRVKQGVDNVLAQDLEEHEDAWDKIIDFCTKSK